MSDEARGSDPIPNSHFFTNAVLVMLLIAVVGYFAIQFVPTLVGAGLTPHMPLTWEFVSKYPLISFLCALIVAICGFIVGLGQD